MTTRYENGFALIVGAGGDLPATNADAKAIYAHLTDPGFCAYPEDNVTLLSEAEAGRDNVLTALDRLADQARQCIEATVIVYFSGHGIEKPAPYLMTNGYDLGELDRTAVSADTFTEKLKAIEAKRLVVLLDCCHAAAQGEMKAPLAQTPIPLPQSAIDELGKSSGRVLIASSRRDEKSWSDRRYSIFTTALLEGLSGHGAFEQDGFARILDIAMWTNRMVPLRTNDTQHPILKVSNLQDNFAVAYYAGGDSQPKAPLISTAETATTPAFDAQQQASWRRMLAHRRTALLLIQERISEYIEYESVPLQYILNERQTLEQIADLESKLGLRRQFNRFDS